MDPPLCIVLPPGTQALLMAVGLVRKMADDGAVVVSTSREHLPILRRVFYNVDVTFWLDLSDPVARATGLGLQVLELPHGDAVAMYAAAKVAAKHMYSEWDVFRDTAKEQELVDDVVQKHGPSFVLVWGRAELNPKFLPPGIPVVDAANLTVANPIDYCGVLQAAMQVHAVDSWFLTLSDLLGGNTKRFCHTVAHPSTALSCRRKYRKRVTIIVCRVHDPAKKC